MVSLNIYNDYQLYHSGLGVNLNSNWTDPCAGLRDVRQVPARPYILCRLGFNFDGAARLFTVPDLLQAYFTYPTRLVQCDYILYRTLVGLSVFLSTHKTINLYTLYRTMVGLSMYLPTYKTNRLYTLYRKMVSLNVRNQSLSIFN